MVGVMAPPMPQSRIQPMAKREDHIETQTSSVSEDHDKLTMSNPADKKKVVMSPSQRRRDAAPRIVCIRNEDKRCAMRLNSIHATGLDERSRKRMEMLIAATSRGVVTEFMWTKVGMTRSDSPNPRSG